MQQELTSPRRMDWDKHEQTQAVYNSWYVVVEVDFLFFPSTLWEALPCW